MNNNPPLMKRKLILLLISIAGLWACNHPQPADDATTGAVATEVDHDTTTEVQQQKAKTLDPAFSFEFLPPANRSQLDSFTLYATQYYIYKATNGGTIPLLDKNEKPLGYSLDTCDWCLAAIEGTLYLKDQDGKNIVLNYAGSSKELQVNCNECRKLKNYANKSIGKSLWAISAGYGDGVSGYKLIPFRTIAVDKTLIPYGSVIYIPLAKGKEISLPDGSTAVHDGYFFAGDKGGDINENHIDVFTGIVAANPFPEVIQSNRQKTFTAYLITDTAVTQKLKSIHR